MEFTDKFIIKDPDQVKDDIYKDLKKILSHEDKYGKLDTKIEYGE